MNPLALTLLLPLLTAIAALAANPRPPLARALGIAGAVLQLANAFWVLAVVREGGTLVLTVGDWPVPIGIALVADLFSALMLIITAIIAVAGALYAVHDVEERLQRGYFFPLFHFLLLGVNGAFITGDLFNLYVWFEVMLMSSFVLMVLGQGRAQLEAGLKYVVLNLVSSTFFLVSAGLLYGKVGTLNMAHLALRLQETPDALYVKASAMLLLAAFGIKSALFPFFFWLPASYHTPRFVVSAVFAGLLTKVGVYALIRTYTLIFPGQFALVEDLFIWLAGATMVVGVLGAAAQFHVRKILSFHIISQIGYMIMGLAIFSQAALTAAIFYILHHIIVKANLFFVGGLIARRCGSEDLAHTGGLYRSSPLLTLIFFVPAFSLAGIPPLSGFWAKYGVLWAAFNEGHYILAGVALGVGLLTLYSMTKIWNEAFWKAPPQANQAPPGPLPRLSLGVCAGLALLTLWLGFAGEPVWELSAQAADQLVAPDTYIHAVLGAPASHETVTHP